mmetsp:Transcript_2/g.16  ORF Transcript_2/g.16 Transcript_2/m.16 type:complete len:86 (-) Transcript_2:850-1107(-)
MALVGPHIAVYGGPGDRGRYLPFGLPRGSCQFNPESASTGALCSLPFPPVSPEDTKRMFVGVTFSYQYRRMIVGRGFAVLNEACD